MQNNHPITVLLHFFRFLKVPVTATGIREELEKHPDAGSLLAISDVLNTWKVPHAAFHIAVENIKELPLPFIAHISAHSGDFVLVTGMDEEYVTVVKEQQKSFRYTLEEFFKLFTGNVLVAESAEPSGEPDYHQKRRKEIMQSLRIPFVLSGLCFLLFAHLFLNTSYLSTLTWPMALLILFTVTGLAVSIFLLIHSIDANNPLVQRLCSGGKHDHCNAILSSPAAKISPELSWSEVGFFYFAGTCLALVWVKPSVPLWQMLALLNLFSLPYTFYSIYYQARIAKQWCRLCCLVQGLLWLQFFAFMPSLRQSLQLADTTVWIYWASVMILPVLIWVFIKPFLLRAKEVQPLKQQLQRFKYNEALFEHLLNQQPKYTLPDETHSLILGNPEAEHTITLVSNPYCAPCAKAHQTLDAWLENRDNIRLQVVFSTQDKEGDPKTKVARHLMALQTGPTRELVKQALNDWYDQKYKEYELWAKNYPVEEHDRIQELLEKQRKWCETANIEATPTIFINGQQLPQLYRIEDIHYFLS